MTADVVLALALPRDHAWPLPPGCQFMLRIETKIPYLARLWRTIIRLELELFHPMSRDNRTAGGVNRRSLCHYDSSLSTVFLSPTSAIAKQTRLHVLDSPCLQHGGVTHDLTCKSLQPHITRPRQRRPSINPFALFVTGMWNTQYTWSMQRYHW